MLETWFWTVLRVTNELFRDGAGLKVGAGLDDGATRLLRLALTLDGSQWRPARKT
jgi:hypothetical protein